MACRLDRNVKLIRILKGRNRPYANDMRFDERGEIGGGGNGGFQALNLVAQFGARRIILLGYDYNADKRIHHHGPHPAGLRNPDAKLFSEWLPHLVAAAPVLAARGIEVVNCSPTSSLTAFPKADLSDIVAAWLPAPSQPSPSEQSRPSAETPTLAD